MGNTTNRLKKIYAVDKGPTTVTLTVVGDESVGKTTLIKAFLNKPADDMCLMNYKEVEVDKKKMMLWIHDDELTQSRGTGAIICFSLQNQANIQRVEDFWIPEIRQKSPRMPLLLVGTKRDLRDESKRLGDCVRTVQGRSLAKKCKLKGYLECSALADTKEEVEEIFIYLLSNRK